MVNRLGTPLGGRSTTLPPLTCRRLSSSHTCYAPNPYPGAADAPRGARGRRRWCRRPHLLLRSRVRIGLVRGAVVAGAAPGAAPGRAGAQPGAAAALGHGPGEPRRPAPVPACVLGLDVQTFECCWFCKTTRRNKMPPVLQAGRDRHHRIDPRADTAASILTNPGCGWFARSCGPCYYLSANRSRAPRRAWALWRACWRACGARRGCCWWPSAAAAWPCRSRSEGDGQPVIKSPLDLEPQNPKPRRPCSPQHGGREVNLG